MSKGTMSQKDAKKVASHNAAVKAHKAAKQNAGKPNGTTKVNVAPKTNTRSRTEASKAVWANPVMRKRIIDGIKLAMLKRKHLTAKG